MTPSEQPGKMPQGQSPAAKRQWRYLPLLGILIGLVAAYGLGIQDYLNLGYLAARQAELKQMVAANPVSSAGLFVLAYIAATALSIPAASVLTVFGGFLFGWVEGGFLVAVGATTGATLLFLATRSAFGGFLRSRASGLAKKLADGFRTNAVAYLLAIRLAPVLPFFAVNIAAALFDIRVSSFVAATFFGILPATFVYAYLGQGIDGLFAVARSSGREVTLGDLVTTDILVAFALLAMLAMVPPVLKYLKRRNGKALP